MDEDRSLSFAGRPLPSWLDYRSVVIAPGERRPYSPEEWRGALIVVEHGELVLHACAGPSLRLIEGAVTVLYGLPLEALGNEESTPVVLSVLRRGAPPATDGKRAADT
jgi:hypothetical protein